MNRSRDAATDPVLNPTRMDDPVADVSVVASRVVIAGASSGTTKNCAVVPPPVGVDSGLLSEKLDGRLVQRSEAFGVGRTDLAAERSVLGEDAVDEVVELGVDPPVFV